MEPITSMEFRERACVEAGYILERTVDDSELLSPAQAAAYLEAKGTVIAEDFVRCDYVVLDTDKMVCVSWDDYIDTFIGWLVDFE